jgi:hypothetical protein
MTADLERALESAAARTSLAPDVAGSVVRRAARRRRLRRAGVASGLVLALVSVPLWRPLLAPARLGPAAADGPYLGWSPRGDLAGDAAFVRSAVAVWDTGSGGPHRDVRVLYAGRSRTVDPVVVVEGLDDSGAPRLGVLTGPLLAVDEQPPAVPGALVVRADRPAPDPAVTRQVSVLARRLPPAGRVELDDELVLLALAEPGATLGVTSTAWDSYSDGRAPGTDLLVSRLPGMGTLANVTVSVSRGSRAVWSGPPGGWSLHDPVAPPGGTVGPLEVWYLPPGYTGSTRPAPVTVGGHAGTRVTYSGDGHTIAVTVVDGGDPAMFVGAGDTASESTAHGGLPATLVRHRGGSSSFVWREPSGLVVSVTASSGVPDIAPYDVSQGLVLR